ncbi:MAG: AAA family ATPase [Myxococcota bacterium]
MSPHDLPAMPDDPVLKRWVQRDLSGADLEPMYESDDLIARAMGILNSGRGLMVMGPTGTGKTALIHELVRRARTATTPSVLHGRRVVQISIRAQLTVLKKPAEEIGGAFNELIEAIFAHRHVLVPYIRDASLAYRFDLESSLAALAEGLGGPVILEGPDSEMKTLLEYEPALAQSYIPMVVEECSLARAEKIVSNWSEAQHDGIDLEAQQTAIQLSHRFLARDRFPRKALHLLDNAAHTAAGPLTADRVLNYFCEVHQVPRHLVDPKIPLDLPATERFFRSQVLGQTDAVSAVVQMVALLKAGLSDVRRPFGVFLFVGPTGVGKTHLAQLLATYLFGSEDRLIRLNMADYQAPQDAVVLFGNPEHHRLSLRQGTLTTRLAGHPFAVVLFDELEKAHQSVIDRFLQLMDEGAFINGNGETVSARSTIVIATSNAGADIYGGRLVGFSGTEDPREIDRKVERALEDTFRLEFLNRFDHVVRFRPLGRPQIRDIARRELQLLRDRSGLTRRQITLRADEAVLDWLTAHGYDPRHGARFLRRVVERNVTTAVAKALVRQPGVTDQILRLTVRRGAIVTVFEDRVSDTTPASPSPAPDRTTHDHAARARQLIQTAGALIAELDRDRSERTSLLRRINAENFYSSSDRADVLKRFRSLDVAVEGDQRDERVIKRLIDQIEQGQVDPGTVRAAERAVTAWQDRRSLNSADRVWLVLARGDALEDEADPFLVDLLQILEAWCRTSGLDAERAAVHRSGGRLQRVVIDVHGPAAEAALSAEVGMHRLHQPDNKDRRICVSTVPHGTGDAAAAELRPNKRVSGPLDLDLRCSARMESDGHTLVLEGGDSELVTQATADLTAAWAQMHPTEIVRLYAVDGVGARDPRTGASVRRFKDLRQGKLAPFLAAWRASQRA